MNKLKALVIAAAALLPIAANAQPAYTARTVELRAGPDSDYPVVAILGSGLDVAVQGCLQDYSWCDVIGGPYRGWVYGGDIVYSYQGAGVPLIDYGAAIGIGVVSFMIGSYWHQHYFDRPWYGRMQQWNHRPPRASVHPRPPRWAMRPAQRPAPAFRPVERPGVHPQPRAGVRMQGGWRPEVHRAPSAAAAPGQSPAHPVRERGARRGRVSAR